MHRDYASFPDSTSLAGFGAAPQAGLGGSPKNYIKKRSLRAGCVAAYD